tara:strand:+ start:14 stop:493 length:480 start_codon:yes stop_codon:yes gene_type:complete
MNKYEKGKIYKLFNCQGMTYYGSTINTIEKRKSKHFCSFKTGKSSYTSRLLFENNKIVKVELVEHYPCNSREELEARERYYIQQFPCVNKVHPGRTTKEYYNDNLVYKLMYQAEYDSNHKEEIKIKNKIYRENNKEILNEKRKIYYHEQKMLKLQEKII